MTLSFSHCLLTIEAKYHAQVPSQVLTLVTCHNILPLWFSVMSIEREAVCIEMELDGFDMEAVERMAKHIADIPNVVGVSRMLMNKRTSIES